MVGTDYYSFKNRYIDFDIYNNLGINPSVTALQDYDHFVRLLKVISLRLHPDRLRNVDPPQGVDLARLNALRDELHDLSPVGRNAAILSIRSAAMTGYRRTWSHNDLPGQWQPLSLYTSRQVPSGNAARPTSFTRPPPTNPFTARASSAGATSFGGRYFDPNRSSVFDNVPPKKPDDGSPSERAGRRRGTGPPGSSPDSGIPVDDDDDDDDDEHQNSSNGYGASSRKRRRAESPPNIFTVDSDSDSDDDESQQQQQPLRQPRYREHAFDGAKDTPATFRYKFFDLADLVARARALQANHGTRSFDGAITYIGVVRRRDQSTQEYPEYVVTASVKNETGGVSYRVWHHDVKGALLQSWTGGKASSIPLADITALGYRFSQFEGFSSIDVLSFLRALWRNGRVIVPPTYSRH